LFLAGKRIEVLVSEENQNYREKAPREKYQYCFQYAGVKNKFINGESEFSPREIAEFLTDRDGVFLFSEGDRKNPQIWLVPSREIQLVEKVVGNKWSDTRIQFTFVPSKNYGGIHG